jgi:hypothetical protein
MARAMKSLFGLLSLVVALLVAATVALPAIVRPMVVSAIRTAAPPGQPLDIRVDLDAFDLLRGVVGRIRVTGSDLRRGGVSIAALDVSATDVGIGDHAFTTSVGTLDGIVIDLDDGTSLAVGTIGLTGPSTGLEAIAHFDAAQAVAFVTHAFDEQGVSVGEIRLAEGGVTFVVFEQQVTVPLAVQDGALVVPDLLGGGTLELLAPRPGDPWRLTGVLITPDSMELDASVDAGSLVASG